MLTSPGVNRRTDRKAGPHRADREVRADPRDLLWPGGEVDVGGEPERRVISERKKSSKWLATTTRGSRRFRIRGQ